MQARVDKKNARIFHFIFILLILYVPFGLLNWVVPIVIIVSAGTWVQKLLP